MKVAPVPKSFKKTEKKMANDNHLSLRYML